MAKELKKARPAPRKLGREMPASGRHQVTPELRAELKRVRRDLKLPENWEPEQVGFE